MKNLKTKKFIVGIMTVLSLALCVFFAACGKKKSDGTYNYTATIAKNDKETLIFTAGEEADGTKSAYDYLVKFKADGKITFEISDGMITSLNGTTPEGNSFWAIYTTLTEKDGTAYSTADWGTYTYEDKTASSAAFGATELPVYAGELYIFALSSY